MSQIGWNEAPEGTPSQVSPTRAAWMRVLALAPTAELVTAMQALGTLPQRHWLRRPETGMTMVQARSGGTGTRFNLGEMTLTRCAVSLRDTEDTARPIGKIGISYVQGRSARHAEYAAIADALLQDNDWHARVTTTVLTPLQVSHNARSTARTKAVAETRVDFFTMERGENPNA